MKHAFLSRKMSEKSHFHSIGLLVIRSDNMEAAARFYSAIGMLLEKHSHPPCGEHYSTVDDNCVFEICQRKPEQPPTTACFFGINVENVEVAVDTVLKSGGLVKRLPANSEWGRTAIITDLDGHSVMLIENAI